MTSDTPSPTKRWNLSISLSSPKKSAKDALFDMATKTLKLLNAPAEIDLKIYKYNINHKLAEEINKLTEEKAEEVLAELKKELEKWQQPQQ
jgi:DNA phosphorothioation-dependent restriction protein DptG